MMPYVPPNDAHLIQVVRGALAGTNGRGEACRAPNVSSCKRIITLHGISRGPDERRAVEEAVRRVPGVLGS
jgi:hypothetical protein